MSIYMEAPLWSRSAKVGDVDEVYATEELEWRERRIRGENLE